MLQQIINISERVLIQEGSQPLRKIVSSTAVEEGDLYSLIEKQLAMLCHRCGRVAATRLYATVELHEESVAMATQQLQPRLQYT